MAAHIKSLILHAHATDPNPVTIAMALEALHVPFEVKLWDFSDNPKTGVKGTGFLRINDFSELTRTGAFLPLKIPTPVSSRGNPGHV